MTVPAQPKICHICHVDRLPSIIASAGLWSDAVLLNQALPGTVSAQRLNQYWMLLTDSC